MLMPKSSIVLANSASFFMADSNAEFAALKCSGLVPNPSLGIDVSNPTE
jgi:hypothetical protein